MLRVPLSGLVPGPRMLDEPTGRYVTRVHRLGAGEGFLAFDPEAQSEARVRILAIGKRVECLVDAVVPSTAPPADSVVLLSCLGKGDKPERVISAATALSVERVTFVESERTVVDLRERGAGRLSRYRTVAVEAARQSGRGDVPLITGPVSLRAVLSDSEDALRVCLAAGAEVRLSEVLATRGGRRLVLLVGPEGGLSDSELELCRASGFSFASLGVHVLRTEIAVIASLGAVAAFRG